MAEKGNGNEKMTLDKLGRIIKTGFDDTNKRIDDLGRTNDERLLEFQSETKKGFKKIDDRLEHIDARLSYIEKDIEDIRKHFVYRDEFEDLAARVKYLEAKMGVTSGK